MENIQLIPTLMSRFGQVFHIQDPQDEQYNKKLARQLISLYYKNQSQQEEDIYKLDGSARIDWVIDNVVDDTTSDGNNDKEDEKVLTITEHSEVETLSKAEGKTGQPLVLHKVSKCLLFN